MHRLHAEALRLRSSPAEGAREQGHLSIELKLCAALIVSSLVALVLLADCAVGKAPSESGSGRERGPPEQSRGQRTLFAQSARHTGQRLRVSCPSPGPLHQPGGRISADRSWPENLTQTEFVGQRTYFGETVKAPEHGAHHLALLCFALVSFPLLCFASWCVWVARPFQLSGRSRERGSGGGNEESWSPPGRGFQRGHSMVFLPLSSQSSADQCQVGPQPGSWRSSWAGPSPFPLLEPHPPPKAVSGLMASCQPQNASGKGACLCSW